MKVHRPPLTRLTREEVVLWQEIWKLDHLADGRAHHDQPQRLCCSSVAFTKTSSGLLLTKYQWKLDLLISSASVCFVADLWIAQFVPWGNRKTIQQQSSNFRNGEKKVLHRILNSKYHDVTRAQNNHGNPMLGFEQAISTRYPTLLFQYLSNSQDWLKILVRLINYWLLFLESGVLGTKKSNLVTSKNCKNAPDTK